MSKNGRKHCKPLRTPRQLLAGAERLDRQLTRCLETDGDQPAWRRGEAAREALHLVRALCLALLRCNNDPEDER